MLPLPLPPDDDAPATQRSPVSALQVRDRVVPVQLVEPPKPAHLRERESGVFMVDWDLDCELPLSR